MDVTVGRLRNEKQNSWNER